jgi:hypothetical protein
MGTRVLLNLGLAVLVLALVLVIWLDPGREGEAPRLTGLAAGAVTRIVIRHGGDDEIRIERGNGQWRMSAPLQAAANEFRIEPLLRVVEATSHARFEAVAGELSRYGLDPPRAVLRADDVEIAFGDTEPIDHRRYMRVGATVHLVEDHYLHRLQAGYPAFVSNRLLPDGGRPVRVELPQFTIAQDALGRWTIEPERDVPIDALDRLVDAWAEARAIIVDRYHGDVAQGTVRVTLEGEVQALEFLVMESEVDLVLALPGSGLVYHLGSEQGARMMDLAPDPGPLP